jgi:hypothetical protein
MNELDKARLGLMAVLAERAPNGQIGRTALMKYMYFLQTLRNVPLRYNFTMYSYGPFDSDVLADLSSGEGMNVVTSTTVMFSGGYGYEIRPGSLADFAKRNAAAFLAEHREDIDWMFATFGNLSAADLELTSTIIYVDREAGEGCQRCSVEDVTERVNDIKPRFSRAQVRKWVEKLLNEGVLSSTGKIAKRA